MTDKKRVVEIETGREGTIIDETSKSYIVAWDDGEQSRILKQKTANNDD